MGVPDPDQQPRSLRVAVVTDQPIVRWQADCVAALAGTTGVRVEAWIPRPSAVPAGDAASGPRALAVADVPDALVGIGAVDEAGSDPHPADVLLDLTNPGLPDASRWAPEVWHFRYGRDRLADATLAAQVDYVRRPGVSRVRLEADPGGRLLREGWLAWHRPEQLDRMLLDTVSWPSAVARAVVDGEPGAPASPDEPSEPRVDPLVGAPAAVRRAAQLGRRISRMPSGAVHHDDWRIGWIDAPIERVAAGGADSRITWLPTPPGHFSADPFGLPRGEDVHVFYEDYDQRSSRGVIGHLVLRADGSVDEPVTVLDPGVHASYPFVIEDEGRVFLLPETSAANRLVLYGATEFPVHWEPVATILDGVPAIDATVVRHDGRWWLFAGRLDAGPNHGLYIWHADDLLGPWVPHAGNPVKTDARGSRPAGTPFVREGALLRPSQDSSSIYGGRVVIQQVDELTPTSFAERPVATVEPPPGSPNPDGMHTIAAAGGRTLVDGNRRRLVWAQLRRDVAAKVRR